MVDLWPAPITEIGKPAPEFPAGTEAVENGDIVASTLGQYAGKYTVLLFYPKDFTYVCPTELIAFSDRHAEFEAINAQVVAISTDTPESHIAWTRMPRGVGGLGHMQIPLVADVTKQVAADYGVLCRHGGDKGIALRGLFIIDNEGLLQQITINNCPVGRSVDETLRLVQAFQFVQEHGEVCPANWKPGEATMKDNHRESGAYFESQWGEGQPAAPIGSRVQIIKTADEYEQAVGGSDLCVAQFGAAWCGKCKMLSPSMATLAEKHKDDVKFVYIDIEGEGTAALCKELGVANVPATRLHVKGVAVGHDVIGYKKQKIADSVESLVSGDLAAGHSG